ncbi:GNAT family N-acetyltransferase [Bacillus sp. S/N-304-OC-R1]|uniref:GNAT family N-acetyltransferase n=1 Tax=Bacillus sp. S/N-304-OC-R1 TaxID=2758034 RepID=UPI001C8F1019|nr:GNAT family N-acetyltransferase [Bacillus sp. S/N-304-OC-R1]MBY0122926.1 GNAT family N-acetyltransferase [Bacillus sp. S/N-304-OC-R1]
MKYIFEGTLFKNGKVQPFVVQHLTMEDLPSILKVQDQVVAHLDGQKTLQPLTVEEFQFILEGKGMMIGAFSNERLIAFRALLVPIIDEEHLGIDIGLAESELPKVIYQEISNVLPEYRGNQLQKTLASLIMKELLKSDHGFRYVCCTVAPFNIPSLKDKFSQGMRIAALKEKYGGSLRYIFVMDLAETGEPEWKESLYIPMEDTVAQQSKLAEGWRGFRMEERDEELYVEYKR